MFFKLPPIVVMVFVCASGCATWGKQETAKSNQQNKSLMDRLPLIGKKKDQEPEPYPNPVKMAATWTPDTLIQTGRTPTRGFGGRIFFYNEKSQPVPVDGTLVIHGFDDQESSDQRKLKRFEFTPEQFTRHFSQSDLGASYSVWIPWDAVGGEQRKISLVASFKTVSGEVVQGIPATIQLPGKQPTESPESELAKFAPEYQRYRKATESATSRTGLATTTIVRRRGKDRQAIPEVDVWSSLDRIATGDTQWMDLAPSTHSAPEDIRPKRIGQLPTQVLPASVRLPSRQ
jgi:hypothetical protein